MGNSLNWKDKLLASGVPLEFDVAKILVEKGFAVNYDYSYQRLDDIEFKEFSVDLHADAFYPFEENTPIHQTVDFLIECKYRHPNKKWVFLPELLDNQSPRFSSVLKLVDEFSNFSFESRTGVLWHYDLCMKGIELNTAFADANEVGIKHGSLQLLYAMPILLREKIYFALRGPLEEVYPFYIIPILITNAELFVVQESFGIEKLHSAKELEDLSYQVDCVRFHVTPPPTFHSHCRNIFSGFLGDETEQDDVAAKTLDYLSELRCVDPAEFFASNSKDWRMHSNPKKFLSSLIAGYVPQFYEDILICHISYLPKLIEEITMLIEAFDKGKQLLVDKKPSKQNEEKKP